MPRKNLPSLCHHKPTGQGFVCFNGRMIYTGKWGSPVSEQWYNQIIADWLVAGRPKDFSPACSPDPNRFTVIELVAAYWRHVESYHVKDNQPTNEQFCIKSAIRFVKDTYGDSPADDFGPRIKSPSIMV